MPRARGRVASIHLSAWNWNSRKFGKALHRGFVSRNVSTCLPVSGIWRLGRSTWTKYQAQSAPARSLLRSIGDLRTRPAAERRPQKVSWPTPWREPSCLLPSGAVLVGPSLVHVLRVRVLLSGYRRLQHVLSSRRVFLQTLPSP